MLIAVAVVGGIDAPGDLVLAALGVGVLALDGHRCDRIDPHAMDDVPWVLARLAVVGLVLLVMDQGGVAGQIPVAAGIVLFGRAFVYGRLRSAKARGLVGERALILGGGEVARELAETLDARPGFGLRPIGPVDLGEIRRQNGRPLEVRITEHVRRMEVTRVLVAFDETDDADLVDAIRALWFSPVRVHAVPRFFELGIVPSGGIVEDLWGIPVAALGRPKILGPGRTIKRAFDVGVAGVALLVLAPVMAVVAMAVRSSGPGSILFRQRRVGRDRREFEMLKFRTMQESDRADTEWHVHEDDRITPVGRVLRRTSLDELPQLVNVLRGDMSLVGPRPERPHYVAWFDRSVRGYAHRHRVDGGMTGWAQIHGRERELEAIHRRARFDNAYIERWSLWGDLTIVARTLRTLISSKG